MSRRFQADTETFRYSYTDKGIMDWCERFLSAMYPIDFFEYMEYFDREFWVHSRNRRQWLSWLSIAQSYYSLYVDLASTFSTE